MSVRSRTDHVQIARVMGIPIYLPLCEPATGGYPVTRGDVVVGLLCLKDVLRVSPEEREATSVQGAMRPLTDAIVTDPDAPLPVAIARMALAGTAQLLVMHGGRLLGLLTMSGVIRRLKVREELAG